MLEKDVIKSHHISDLHIAEEEQEDVPIYTRYIKFLEGLAPNERPDLLVITGDLPFKGGEDIKSKVKHFLEDLWDPTKKLLNINEQQGLEEAKKVLKAHTLVVPGNHDVCWLVKGGAAKLQVPEQGLAFLLNSLRGSPFEAPNPYTNFKYEPHAISCVKEGVGAFMYPRLGLLFCCFDSTVKGGEFDKELLNYFESVEQQRKLLAAEYDGYWEAKKKGQKSPAETDVFWKKVTEEMKRLCRIDPGFIPANVFAALDDVLSTVPKLPTGDYGAAAVIPLRIAMVHHNPCIWSPEDERKRFALFPNACVFLSVLRSHGFHLVLCGHAHQPCLLFHYDHLMPIDSLSGRINRKGVYILGAGSLSSRSEQKHSFNEILVYRASCVSVRLKLKIWEFDSNCQQFSPIPIGPEQVQLDLVASTDEDSKKCAEIKYEQLSTIRRGLSRDYNEVVKKDFDNLMELFDNVLEVKQRFSESLRSAGDWHLARGRRWFSGLKQVGKELAGSLRDALASRQENSTVELFAVHVQGGEYWRREEVFEYLNLQIDSVMGGRSSVSRIFLYEGGRVNTGSGQELQTVRHLVGALDEQAHAGVKVHGMEVGHYAQLMQKLAAEQVTKPFCAQLLTGTGMANDWLMMNWVDKKTDMHWRLFVQVPNRIYKRRF